MFSSSGIPNHQRQSADQTHSFDNMSNSKSTPSLDNLPTADFPSPTTTWVATSTQSQTLPTTSTPTYQSKATPHISLSRSTSPHTSQCDQHLAVQRLSGEHVGATSTSPGLNTTLEGCPGFAAWNEDDGSTTTENARGTSGTTIDKGKSRTPAATYQQSKNAASDEQDQKRRKLTEPEDTFADLPLALLKDIGEILAVGGTGQVFKYKSDLVLKVVCPHPPCWPFSPSPLSSF